MAGYIGMAFNIKDIVLIALLLFPALVHSSCVVLLHGLGRSESSMGVLEKRLIQEGYSVVNQGYPSREFPIEVLANKAIKPALLKCSSDTNISFVTHSLGGILVRQYLNEKQIPNLHRVVMLGPPNKGSEVVDKLNQVPGFNFVVGEAGLQLGTSNISVPNRLGKANFDVGIIAGTKSINLILSTLIPQRDDGKVSVENTKLDGMKDYLKIPVSHPFLMSDDKVIHQIIYYLREGKFERNIEADI